MKFFVAFAALFAVAAANPLVRPTKPVSSAIVPSPVVFGPLEPGQPIPLVQIIVNVNKPEPVSVPQPIDIVDVYPVVEPVIPEPVQVVEPVIPEPVLVVEPVIPEPVQVVEPIIVEPVIVGTPIIPEPAVVLPEELN